MPSVRDLISNDDMMLGVDRSLDVVADDPAVIAAGCHGTRIWIGKRDLPVGRGF